LLLPALMNYTAATAPEKYIEMGANIFGLRLDTEDADHAAGISIDAMKGWLASVGRLLTFTDLGIDDSGFEAMADDVVRVYMRDKDHLQNPRPINRDGVMEIFRMSL
jgi:alcohol dehydrogenase YqhD (iron-dependent ADH family)